MSAGFALEATARSPGHHECRDSRDSQQVGESSVPTSRYDAHDHADDAEPCHTQREKAQPGHRHERIIARRLDNRARTAACEDVQLPLLPRRFRTADPNSTVSPAVSGFGVKRRSPLIGRFAR